VKAGVGRFATARRVQESPGHDTRENLDMQPSALRLSASILVALLALAGPAARASDTDPAHGEAPHTGTPHYQHELTLFLGVTDESGHDSQGTVGVEYLHRMGERWGMGGLIDYAGGNQRNWIAGVPFAWNPVGKLKLIAAPCIEQHEGRGETAADGHGEVDEDETAFVFRLGASYEFPVSDHWRIAPALNLDFVEGHRVWIYGANLSYGW
jgi:hypothetical protein